MTSRDVLQRRLTVLVALVACFAMFFAKPLFLVEDGFYTAWDLTQDLRLTGLDESHAVGNRLLGDTVTEMQPWLLFNRDELAAGRFPHWNPYNGNGVPHHANYQSAVFSPFSWPFYVLSFRAALLVSAMAKLATIALFTWLFLCELGYGRLSALVGTIAFTFSAHNVLLLGYPHVGAVAFLPAALFALERALHGFEARREARAAVPGAVGLAAALALVLFGGHPEAAFWSIVLVALWASARLCGMALRQPRGSRRPVLDLGGILLLAGLASAALSAVQWLPFFEYLAHSNTGHVRTTIFHHPLTEQWPLFLFPNALGSPVSGWTLDMAFPKPNYEQANTAYTGGLVLLAAALSLLVAWRDRRARWWGLFAILWLFPVFDVFGLGRAFDSLPGAKATPLSRSQMMWGLALAVCATAAVEQLLARTTRVSLARVALACAAAIGVLALSWRGAVELCDSLPKGVLLDVHVRPVFERVREHGWFIASTTVAGIGTLALLARSASPSVKRVCVLAFGALCFTQTGLLLRNYNPTTTERYVMPRSSAIETLCARAGDRRLIVLGDNGLPGHTNMPHGLFVPAVYDALSVRRYDELYTHAFNSVGGWRDATVIDRKGLDLFGIEHVVTPTEWLPAATGLGARLANRDNRFHTLHLFKEMRLEQHFRPDADGLRSVALLAGLYQHLAQPEAAIELTLIEDETQRVLAERTFTAAQIRASAVSAEQISMVWKPFDTVRAWLGRMLVLEFPPEPDSAGRDYRLIVEAPGGSGNDSVLIWWTTSLHAKGCALTSVGKSNPNASLYFDYATGADGFERARRAGSYWLHDVRDSLGSFYVVGRARLAEPLVPSLAVLGLSAFDPRREVLLDELDVVPEDARDSDEPSERAVVLERRPGRLHLGTDRREPGWLVATETWFPGWSATLDDQSVPILRANAAFMAVRVPAGQHEVVLTYAPLSFRIGLWTSLASLLCALVCAWFSWPRVSTASAPS